MLRAIFNHKIRKELVRKNKVFNHREYLSSLKLLPKIKYWSGYHKKKLIFFALCLLISWNYDLHYSLYYKILQLRSPKQLISHLFLGSVKPQKTVNEQKIVGWPFAQETLNLLSKVYYEADKRLVFGVGRNYLFQVYQSMGLLQKDEEVRNFWIAGGFYRKRNQLVSGVGYQQFMVLFMQGFRTLKKSRAQLDEEQYLREFIQIFIKKSKQITNWETEFNKHRYGEYLKALTAQSEVKGDQINSVMKENLDISEEQLEKKLKQMGLKGLSIRDRWVYITNREVLYSLREFSAHKKLNLSITQGRERALLEQRLSSIESELKRIEAVKAQLKQRHLDLYQEELI